MKIFWISKFAINFLIIVMFGYVNTEELKGPFLLWGNENLNSLKSSALSEIDENTLIATLSSFDVILLFQKPMSFRLDKKNFPFLNEIVEENTWVFMHRNNLPVELFDYVSNVEIIKLHNDDLNIDKMICKTYKDRIESIGNGRVLGILSNFLDTTTDDRSKFKRSIVSKQNIHPIIYTDENEDILLYTSSAPILEIRKEEFIIEEVERITLRNVKSIVIDGIVDNDDDDRSTFNFTIFYVENFNQSISLKFLFETSLGYWSVSTVEIETDEFTGFLNLVGDDKPSAPFGFSYWCGKSITFMDENENSLKLANIQLEPFFWKNENRNDTRFSDAYDCVGFMTVPILSGIFISFFILFVTLVGIVAIMEIKTPIRYDNSKTKQLTIILSDQDIRN